MKPPPYPAIYQYFTGITESAPSPGPAGHLNALDRSAILPPSDNVPIRSTTGGASTPGEAGQILAGLCRKCRKCSPFHKPSNFRFGNDLQVEASTPQGKKKRTETAVLVRISVRKNANSLKISVFCGGERTRTAVQTPHQAAFYTLIRPLVFVPSLPDGGRRRP